MLPDPQLVVAGFSTHVEIARAHEIANEVRRVKKQLKDCQHLAMLYNNRERIFGLPITNVGLLWAPCLTSQGFRKPLRSTAIVEPNYYRAILGSAGVELSWPTFLGSQDGGASRKSRGLLKVILGLGSSSSKA